MALPSSTWSFAPPGRLSPSGNCTRATGVWVSLGTRMLTRTINCPVLLSTAVCSMAHSSAASRLALLHRAAQPDEAGALADAASACAGAAVVWAGRGGALDL